MIVGGAQLDQQVCDYIGADTTMDDSGNAVEGAGTDLMVYANVTQLCWMTEKKLFGADYGLDFFIPFVYSDLEVVPAGIDENTFGLGDMFIDPLVLGWHGKQWDAFLAAGAYMPTGEHDEPTSPGKGYWTFMEQVGGTVYFDTARTLTAAARVRFEQSTKDDDTDTTAGDEMIFEYGLGKDFSLSQNLLATIGVAGYSYYQLTADSGPEAADTKFSGHGVGPEIQLTIFKPFINLTFRYEFEYGVENQTEGDNATFAITGSF
ncbi:hypothetical protein Dvar_68850 [Desulfosarcina variabilis str. Montpellier]|uniref:SphA family protein n=1 Tax=Desulfosarcina variabilis TaxID=2300 RepID=UPI003AFA51B9